MRTAIIKTAIRKKIAPAVFAAAFVFAACAEEAQIEIDIPNLSSTASVAVVSSASDGAGNSEGEDASGSGESGGASAAGGKESAGGNASNAHSEGTVSENGGSEDSYASGNSEGAGESADGSIDSNASSLSGGASSQGAASENGGLSASSASSMSSVVSSASSSSLSSALPLPGDNEYIVVYNGNGATAGSMDAGVYTIGSPHALTANGYTRAGYTFAGWNTEAAGAGTSYTAGQLVYNLRGTQGYITLYAQWIAISYTVTYNGNGAEGSMSSSAYTYDAAQNLTANTFTRAGYTFAGWNTEANGSGTAYADGASVLNLRSTPGSVTLYAEWTPITYIVAYYKNHDDAAGTMEASLHTYGEFKALTANGYTRAGYGFAGWNTAANGTGTQYTDGQSVRNLSSTQGDVVILSAQWGVQYTVLYDKNAVDASGSTAPSTHTYGVGKALTANSFTRAGYTFFMWTTQANGYGTDYEDGESVLNLRSTAGSVTLYAYWLENEYTVTFNNNGGSGVNPATKTVTWPATTVALPTTQPTRAGYTFAGWNTAANGSGTAFTASYVLAIAAASGTLTVYAQWTPITYTVLYDGNGADGGSMEPSDHTYGTYKNLTANAFTRDGYGFVGWNTAANGSGSWYSNGQSVSALRSTPGSVTLYAQWGIQYTVVYDKNADDASGTTEPSTHTYGTYETLTANAFTRDGYGFVGWNTAANGSGTSYTAGASVLNLRSTPGSVTLYAQWGIQYTVMYDKNADDALGTMEPSTHTYGVSKSLTANAYTRAGYVFAGWNTAANGGGTNYSGGASVLNLRNTPGSVTLYAQWAAQYTVVYDKNATDALGSMEPSTHTYGVSKSLTANGFTREGYILTGWNTASDGSGTAYANGASVLNLRSTPGSVTLYAQWGAEPVTTIIPGSSVELTMNGIPAGAFAMGSPVTEPGRNAVRETQHSVTLTKGFYMGQYEVTQEQYQAVMSGNANGLSASPSWFTSSPASGEVQAKRPVERVSWYDALVFCNRLSLLAGLTPVYSISGSTDPANWGTAPTFSNATWNAVSMNSSANGYRLPTEAEWEYACRAGTTTAHSFGDSINGDYAWHGSNSAWSSVASTHEVGKKLPNAWGLYDMHGNVLEWCWDWYGDYASSAVTDPTGPAAGTKRVRRGGSCYDGAAYLRSAYRHDFTPDGRDGTVGFRLVCAVP